VRYHSVTTMIPRCWYAATTVRAWPSAARLTARLSPLDRRATKITTTGRLEQAVLLESCAARGGGGRRLILRKTHVSRRPPARTTSRTCATLRASLAAFVWPLCGDLNLGVQFLRLSYGCPTVVLRLPYSCPTVVLRLSYGCSTVVHMHRLSGMILVNDMLKRALERARDGPPAQIDLMCRPPARWCPLSPSLKPPLSCLTNQCSTVHGRSSMPRSAKPPKPPVLA